jgi:hypothetical protein
MPANSARGKSASEGTSTIRKNTRPWCTQHDCLRSRCHACTLAGVHGAGSELCTLPGHTTKKGALAMKFDCARCIGEGLRPPRIKSPTRDPGVECRLLICDLANATGNLAGKGYEVKKMSVSDRHGYNSLTGPIIQAVQSAKQYVDQCDVIHPTSDMQRSSGSPKGRCEHCARAPGELGYAVSLPPISAPEGRIANWALGEIWFEPGNAVELYIPRELRPGRSESETCACAWKYTTRPLEDLFQMWRPRNGEKRVCISFLAHYAWTTSTGTAMRARDHPGRLRAHKIVKKKRFARMQPWSTPRSMSSCTLRRGGKPDAWVAQSS